MNDLIEIRDLSIQYKTEDGVVRAVNHTSFSIGQGETLGLVGETGAGKTTTALGIIRLIPNPPGEIVGGEILYKGKDLVRCSEREMRKIRGEQISMIFQDPMTALDPTKTVLDQIAEVVRIHSKSNRAMANAKAAEMLRKVGIDPARGGEYPHQFSGGMKQRVVIAMALACSPSLLIADEPTTALDVTIQAQILNMMRSLKEEFNTSMLLITHDMGIVAEMCDKVAVMYAGEIVEFGTLEEVLDNPKHPYTKGLFGSIPKLHEKTRRLKPIEGLMPDPANLPDGCKFHPRCPYSTDSCRCKEPENVPLEGTHYAKCLLFESRKETEL